MPFLEFPNFFEECDCMYEIFEKLLKEKGVKAADVVRATGIKSPVFSEWKKGKSSPNVDKLILIANYFGVSVEYLRTGFQPKFSSEMAAIDLELTDMPLEMKKYALKLAELPEEKQKQIMSLIDMLEG